MEAEVGGEPFAICNAGGELFALAGVCPHAGGPLGQGAHFGEEVRGAVRDAVEHVDRRLAAFPGE